MYNSRVLLKSLGNSCDYGIFLHVGTMLHFQSPSYLLKIIEDVLVEESKQLLQSKGIRHYNSSERKRKRKSTQVFFLSK